MKQLSPTSNPFSAARVSGGRLPYFFADSTTEEHLLGALDRHKWIGQIIGPHGSGKTTLAYHLWSRGKTRFPSLVQVTIRGRREIQRRVSGGSWPRLYVVDGIEHLSRVDRWLFLRGFVFRSAHLRGQGDGLIVTGHRVLSWLPKVFETSFNKSLLHRLTKELLSAAKTTDIPGGDDDVFSGEPWNDFSRALLQRHGSNCREIFMDMYDHFETVFNEKHFPDTRFYYQKPESKSKLSIGRASAACTQNRYL